MRKHKGEQRRLPVLWLYAEDGSVLYHERLDAFPFPEAVVLAGCEKYFGDSNPCEIHRRALQLRLCAEMERVLPANQKLYMDALPSVLRQYCREIQPYALQLEKAE
jgi:hypothetical protein